MGTPGRLLLVNPGSASKKYALYAGTRELAAGRYELCRDHVAVRLELDGAVRDERLPLRAFPEAPKRFVAALTAAELVSSRTPLRGAAIRIVASGSKFQADRRLDGRYLRELERAVPRSPLHLPPQLAEARYVQRTLRIPIVGISDSAFHRDLPDVARRYGLPAAEARKHDVYRFGYHGLSVASVVRKLRRSGQLKPRVIVCHLGSGDSVTALRAGKSVDTSMGFTPLEGLLMATRSGDLDPDAVLYLAHFFETPEALERHLNLQSGLRGVGGHADVRELLAAEKSDPAARFALDLFAYRVKKMIGAYAAALGGLDRLVFTGTIGERSAPMRKRITSGLEFLGIRLDPVRNRTTVERDGSLGTRVVTIQTDETSEMARRAARLLP